MSTLVVGLSAELVGRYNVLLCCNYAAMFPNRVRCSKSMNHERDGLHHTPPTGSACKFVHQLGNQVLLCNVRGEMHNFISCLLL